MTTTRKRKLSLEQLCERDVPAAFGTPWFDSTHLTMSFAPDGTSAAGVATSLFTTLDAQMPREEWQGILRRAAQTWSEASNVNIGIVADGGQPFGIDGETQADPRFGDIRIGALPMADDALGEAVAPDALLAGTFAGDVFFNSTATFTPNTLYRVALHEIGHALGLPPNTDPRSVMFNQVSANSRLAISDYVAIRSLYGLRTVDINEKATGNGRLATSTRLNFPSGYDGEIPLAIFGTLGSRADVDVFRLKNLGDYSGPITVQVITEGISLVVPKVSVYDFRARLVGSVVGSNPNGESLEFTIPATLPGRMYYFRVEAAPNSEQRIGRFGLAATFDDRVKPLAIPIADVLRGPYDHLDSDDLSDLFEDPEHTLYNNDNGEDDDSHDAVDLRGKGLARGQSRFAMTASIDMATDVDFIRVRAPRFGARTAVTLIASARAVGPIGTTPRIEVFDRNENPLAAEVLLNGAARYTVQVPDVESGRRYYLRLSSETPGNYTLEASFRKQEIELETFAAGSATSSQPMAYKLYAARTQLFGFALSATGPVGSIIRFTMTNQAGEAVFSLNAKAGDTVSGLSTFLAPGEYSVRVDVLGTEEQVAFTIRGAVQTDPIGPQPGDSSLGPIYLDPEVPGLFRYPGGDVSFDPYLWIIWAIV